MDKFKNDGEFKKLSTSFFQSSWEARYQTREEAVNAINSALKGSFKGVRMNQGIVFNITPEISATENKLVRRCVRLLGTKIGNEKEIANALWHTAAEMKTGDTKKAQEKLLITLRELNEAEFSNFLPNYVIRFEDNIEEVEIGPVKAKVTNAFIKDFNKKNKKSKFRVEIGEPKGFTITEKNEFIYYMSPICWEVRVNASKENVEEESLWLINTALSLLRLCLPQTYKQPFYPGFGEIEANPIANVPTDDAGVKIDKNHFWAGGMKARRYYTFDKEILNHFEKIDFEERTKQIFSNSKGKIAERIRQGLGWMTRGRQAHDRAERFLFFFTAIEALLTSSDKTAPVIQTIARHAAVILSNEMEDRKRIANTIKKAYETRSKLIHGGRREVSHYEASEIQVIVEALYKTVLDKVNLTESSAKFESSLSSASYGIEWPTK